MNPKLMEQAMQKNMIAKTGRPLNKWIELLKNKNNLTKNELVDFLKNDHSIGHFYVQLILKEFYK